MRLGHYCSQMGVMVFSNGDVYDCQGLIDAVRTIYLQEKELFSNVKCTFYLSTKKVVLPYEI